MLKLDLIHTLAFGGLALLAGYGLRRFVPVLGRLNMPAAVLGGLLVSGAAWIGHARGVQLFTFDTTLQSPLMIAFFTTVGFGASLSMLRVGGPMVLRFLLLAGLFALLQNVLGVAIALAFGLDPLFGILAGSVTLTGGPATGLAFAPLFEAAGVTGAASLAVAMAMAGIVSGALTGSPVATWIIHRHGLHTGPGHPHDEGASGAGDGHGNAPAAASDEAVDETLLLKNVIALLLAMWAGSWVSAGFAHAGMTLPAYIGAMLVAALFRNVDDLTGWFGLSGRVLDSLGAVTLSLFLVMALMNLRLWEITTLALPLVVTLAAQIALAAFGATVVFGRLGRDYEAAVMGGGFIGFMMGTTANAMAVMRALVERYGPAPRAFLVAPLVGAFFLDFINALLITAGINLLR